MQGMLTIGTGIFVLTGVAAHDLTGPALMLSFVRQGLTCFFAAPCYAEFASMVPVAGSAYALMRRLANSLPGSWAGTDFGIRGGFGHSGAWMVALFSGFPRDSSTLHCCTS